MLTVILTNAVNDFQKEKQFRKLNAKKEDKKAIVLRNEREQSVSNKCLVVGDIIELEPGNIVPADCIYLTGYKLACDESSSTGESDAVVKQSWSEGTHDVDCFILSGSKVLEGVARAVVIAVGQNSYFGKTMMGLRHGRQAAASEESTPLQLKLDILAEQIAKAGFAAALAMLVTLVTKFFIVAFQRATFPDSQEIASTLVSIIIQAITIIVVAVPEGLPMAVTMALAFATTQMLKDNNLVRVLAACETMGNATTICTDKTGTLTQNRMKVAKGFLGNTELAGEDNVDAWAQEVDRRVVDLIVEGVSVNSTAFEETDEHGQTEFLGSTTERALLVFAKQLGGDYVRQRRDAEVVKVYPFSSRTKTMTTVLAKRKNCYCVHVKGASEIVLRSCTRYLGADGQPLPLDDQVRRRWEKVIDEDATKALRTIALAYCELNHDEYASTSSEEDEPPLEELTMIGVVGIQDPLRPGVVEAVRAFRQAGVFVRMVTGDNLKTAKAIARDAGILTQGGVALSAAELRKMTPQKQREVIRRMQVLARSSPADKTNVVIRLQELDQIVGMTGDGTNDGPALKLADVGFSMGITGTEVAKEASDIILMDDNFNSILKALLWGRTVNDGVRKFLTFQLTVNVAAVVISFVSSVTSDKAESVLSAVQLLWVNLIMDTLAALALATEPPSMDLLNRKPSSKYAHLINYQMIKMILCQAAFQIVVNLTIMYAGFSMFQLDQNSPADRALLRTMVFNIFVFLQIFNELNCRRIDTINVFKDIQHDYIFIAVQASVLVCQVLIVTFGGIAFSTVPLSPLHWLITVAIGALSLPVGFIIRMVPDCFGCEQRFNQDARPLASYSQLNWEGAIDHVRTQLRVYSILRKSYYQQQSSKLPPSQQQDRYNRPLHRHAYYHPNKNVSEPGSSDENSGKGGTSKAAFRINVEYPNNSSSSSLRSIRSMPISRSSYEVSSPDNDPQEQDSPAPEPNAKQNKHPDSSF